MKSLPLLLATASILFTIVLFSVWKQTRDWEALLFVALSVLVVIVTTVWAVKTILSESKEKEDEE